MSYVHGRYSPGYSLVSSEDKSTQEVKTPKTYTFLSGIKGLFEIKDIYYKTSVDYIFRNRWFTNLSSLELKSLLDQASHKQLIDQIDDLSGERFVSQTWVDSVRANITFINEYKKDLESLKKVIDVLEKTSKSELVSKAEELDQLIESIQNPQIKKQAIKEFSNRNALRSIRKGYENLLKTAYANLKTALIEGDSKNAFQEMRNINKYGKASETNQVLDRLSTHYDSTRIIFRNYKSIDNFKKISSKYTRYSDKQVIAMHQKSLQKIADKVTQGEKLTRYEFESFLSAIVSPFDGVLTLGENSEFTLLKVKKESFKELSDVVGEVFKTDEIRKEVVDALVQYSLEHALDKDSSLNSILSIYKTQKKVSQKDTSTKELSDQRKEVKAVSWLRSSSSSQPHLRPDFGLTSLLSYLYQVAIPVLDFDTKLALLEESLQQEEGFYNKDVLARLQEVEDFDVSILGKRDSAHEDVVSKAIDQVKLSRADSWSSIKERVSSLKTEADSLSLGLNELLEDHQKEAKLAADSYRFTSTNPSLKERIDPILEKVKKDDFSYNPDLVHQFSEIKKKTEEFRTKNKSLLEEAQTVIQRRSLAEEAKLLKEKSPQDFKRKFTAHTNVIKAIINPESGRLLDSYIEGGRHENLLSSLNNLKTSLETRTLKTNIISRIQKAITEGGLEGKTVPQVIDEMVVYLNDWSHARERKSSLEKDLNQQPGVMTRLTNVFQGSTLSDFTGRVYSAVEVIKSATATTVADSLGGPSDQEYNEAMTVYQTASKRVNDYTKVVKDLEELEKIFDHLEIIQKTKENRDLREAHAKSLEQINRHVSSLSAKCSFVKTYSDVSE